MRKYYSITIDVLAYSRQDAQARMDALLQLGALVKDFNLRDFAHSILKSIIISKIDELMENKKTEATTKTEKVSGLCELFENREGWF